MQYAEDVLRGRKSADDFTKKLALFEKPNLASQSDAQLNRHQFISNSECIASERIYDDDDDEDEGELQKHPGIYLSDRGRYKSKQSDDGSCFLHQLCQISEEFVDDLDSVQRNMISAYVDSEMFCHYIETIPVQPLVLEKHVRNAHVESMRACYCVRLDQGFTRESRRGRA